MGDQMRLKVFGDGQLAIQKQTKHPEDEARRMSLRVRRKKMQLPDDIPLEDADFRKHTRRIKKLQMKAREKTKDLMKHRKETKRRPRLQNEAQ